MIENLTNFEHVQNLHQLEYLKTCTVLCVSCTNGHSILPTLSKMVVVFWWGKVVFWWGKVVLIKPYMLRVYDQLKKSNILINILINKIKSEENRFFESAVFSHTSTYKGEENAATAV